jgi:hypothetical protein
MSLNSESVAAFGKIIFVPVTTDIPHLPVMNLLFFNDRERGDIYPWRAVCIDLELDAVGDTMDDAWNSLKESLTIYIDMQKRAANGSIVEAAKTIVKEAFADSTQKQEYIKVYRKVKLDYTMKNLESAATIDPVSTEKRIVETVRSGQKEPICRVIDELMAA